MIDVTVNVEVEGTYGVKLQDDTWELNIHAAPDDLRNLTGIRDATWAEGRSLRIGTCAGAPVWWCEQGDSVTILVGDDDQVWDAAVTVSLSTVHEILRLTEQVKDEVQHGHAFDA
ncbi:MAG TPA: hypothetical protein VF834_12910 [Streptosporangiaceae bacterium]